MRFDKRLAYLIPAAALLIFFGVLAFIVIGKDAIIDLLTPKTELERNAVYVALFIAGVVIMYFILRHVKPYKSKRQPKL